MNKPAKSVKTQGESTARVSVIVPVFNHEEFVQEAVLSALSQAHPVFEVIVIDDGSIDKSFVRLNALAQRDSRVKIFRQTNRGSAATINRGLSLATGQWLAILNSDDRWPKSRIERLLYVAATTSAKVIFSRCTPIDQDGNVLPADHPWQRMYLDLMTDVANLGLKQAICKGNPVVSSSNFFFHRSALKLIGLLRYRRFVPDWDWALRASLQSELRSQWCDESLLDYRIHKSNTIAGSGLRSSMEIVHMLNRLQVDFPDHARAIEPTRTAFVRDVRKHVSRAAYAKGQLDTDLRHQIERDQARERIENLVGLLSEERSLSQASRDNLTLERDEARAAQQASHAAREQTIAEFSAALNDAAAQRDADLAQLRQGYEAALATLQSTIDTERSLAEQVRNDLTLERDEARAAQQASHAAREQAIAEFSAALNDAAAQRDADLADMRASLESLAAKRDADLANMRAGLELEIGSIRAELSKTQRLLKYEQEKSFSHRFRKLWIR